MVRIRVRVRVRVRVQVRVHIQVQIWVRVRCIIRELHWKWGSWVSNQHPYGFNPLHHSTSSFLIYFCCDLYFSFFSTALRFDSLLFFSGSFVETG